MTMVSEQFGEILCRLHAGFRRTLSKGVLIKDPHMELIHDRLQAFQPDEVLNTPIEQSRFIVIDTETTGLKAYGDDEIVSISLLEMIGLQLTGNEFSSLINPARDIPASATAIHNITQTDVSEAPIIEEVLAEVIDFIGEGVLVGHHVGFDIRFINKVLQKELLCRIQNPWIDTMLLFLAYTGQLGHYSLEEVAASTKVDIIGRHTSYGDALTTAHIFMQLAKCLSAEYNSVGALTQRQCDLGDY